MKIAILFDRMDSACRKLLPNLSSGLRRALTIIEPCPATILTVEFEHVESAERHARILHLWMQLVEDRESVVVADNVFAI
jgi:hypothetical protein